MKNIPSKKSIVYAKGYARTIVVINQMAKNYTIPQLYIPKGVDGKPTVAKGKYWYVWYYFRNPITNKFDRSHPIIVKGGDRNSGGINRLKSARERLAFGKELIQELNKLLKDGYSPYEVSEFSELATKRLTVVEALDYALSHKKNEVKQSTYYDYENRKSTFVEWLVSKNLQHTFINEIKKNHITSYLNQLSKTVSSRNVNNHKAALSALFTKLVDDNDEILSTNVILGIKNRTTKPSLHKSYSKKELATLKEHLIEKDQYLYDFMRFVAYSFMRNVEVTRLQVKHLDIENWNIIIESKTDAKEFVPIIETLRPIIADLNLSKYNREDFIFTPLMHPGEWTTKRERYKVGWFAKRFKKVKKSLELEFENTIYSMRHTAAIDLYNHFISEGYNEHETILKMLPITRHTKESGLRNYLRSVNAFKVEDYSDKFSMDF